MVHTDMTSGSSSCIEIGIKTDLSLVSEMIFSFFAGDSDRLILQKRYPDDITEVDGRYYLGFTQEETVKLYKNSEDGSVQLETQVNFGDKTVTQLPVRGLKIRRTRAVSLVAGNAPRYDMPDEVVDIKTGDVVLLRGEKGEKGDTYSLTEADKTEIAEEAAALVDTALLDAIGSGVIT